MFKTLYMVNFRKVCFMKKIIKYFLFIFIFLIILSIVSKILNPAFDTNVEWYISNSVGDLYKSPKNTLDVMFVGDSCIYTAVSPLEIYNDTGITSFDLSTPGQKLWSSYYLLKEAFKTQKPKVCFIECGEYMMNAEFGRAIDKRAIIDTLKISKNKLDVINDKIYDLSFIEKIGALIPAIEYHSRWQEIDETDIRKNLYKSELTYKGFVYNPTVMAYNGNNKFSKSFHSKHKNSTPTITEDDKKLEKSVSENSQKYFSKIIDLCNQNNCTLILLKIPDVQDWTDEKHNVMEAFSEINNLTFIDLNYNDSNISIDWSTDSSDSGYHLNIKGAQKVSKYLAKYLKENFNLDSHKNDPNYDSWNTAYDNYCQIISSQQI